MGKILGVLVLAGCSWGQTITVIQGSDTVSSSRAVINTNFAELNTWKGKIGACASGQVAIETTTSGVVCTTVALLCPTCVTAAGTLTSHGVALGAGSKALGVTAVGGADTLLQGQGSSSDPSFVGLVNCANDGAHGLVYSTSTHSFACASIAGTGIVNLTTGASDPSASCTAPSSGNLTKYYQTTAKTLWTCTDTNTWRLDLNSNPAVAMLILGNTGTAPSTPASGKVAVYSDSTQLGLSAKDAAGQISRTIVPTDCSTGGQVLGKVNADGSVTCVAGGSGGGFNAPVVYASLPSCSTTAFYQLILDGILAFSCDGASTLQAWYGTQTITRPGSASGWTAIGNLTKTDSKGTLALAGAGNASATVNSVVKAIPGSPFDIRVGIKSQIGVTNGTSTSFGCGLIVTAGTLTSSAMELFAQITYQSVPNLILIQATDNTLGSAASPLLNYDKTLGADVQWFRVVQDSTNLTYYNSVDGKSWTQQYQEAKTSFLAVSHYGIGCLNQTVTPVQVTFLDDTH